MKQRSPTFPLLMSLILLITNAACNSETQTPSQSPQSSSLAEQSLPSATPLLTASPELKGWAKVIGEASTIPVLRPTYLPPAVEEAAPGATIYWSQRNGQVQYSVFYSRGKYSLSITGQEGWNLVVHQAPPQGNKTTIALGGGSAALFGGTYPDGSTRVTVHWCELVPSPPSAQSSDRLIVGFLVDSINLPSEEVIRTAESLQSVGVFPLPDGAVPLAANDPRCSGSSEA